MNTRFLVFFSLTLSLFSLPLPLFAFDTHSGDYCSGLNGNWHGIGGFRTMGVQCNYVGTGEMKSYDSNRYFRVNLVMTRQGGSNRHICPKTFVYQGANALIATCQNNMVHAHHRRLTLDGLIVNNGMQAHFNGHVKIIGTQPMVSVILNKNLQSPST